MTKSLDEIKHEIEKHLLMICSLAGVTEKDAVEPCRVGAEQIIDLFEEQHTQLVQEFVEELEAKRKQVFRLHYERKGMADRPKHEVSQLKWLSGLIDKYSSLLPNNKEGQRLRASTLLGEDK